MVWSDVFSRAAKSRHWSWVMGSRLGITELLFRLRLELVFDLPRRGITSSLGGQNGGQKMMLAAVLAAVRFIEVHERRPTAAKYVGRRLTKEKTGFLRTVANGGQKVGRRKFQNEVLGAGGGQRPSTL